MGISYPIALIAILLFIFFLYVIDVSFLVEIFQTLRFLHP